jgi:hypothetical protein
MPAAWPGITGTVSGSTRSRHGVVGLIVVAALALLLARPMGYLLLFALIPLDASIAPAAPFPCAYRKAKGSIDVYDRTDGRAGVGCPYPASPRDQDDGRYSESRSTGDRLAA